MLTQDEIREQFMQRYHCSQVVIREWAEELGYVNAVVESRDNKVPFYELLGYEICGEAKDGDTFRCIRMEKEII